MRRNERAFCLGLGILLLSVSAGAAAPVHLWSQRFGGTGSDYGRVVAVDASDNVILTGRMWGTTDFGGGNLVSAGLQDVFVAKYDASGAHEWSQRFGGTGWDEGLAIAVDASGNVIVTGYFHGTVDFGGGNLVSAGAYDVFVAKYDASGAHEWSHRFGGTSNDVGCTIAVDALGNVVVTGFFVGTVDFGGGNLVSAGSADVFVAKYDASGAHQWSHRFGGANSDESAAIAVDASGNVIVAGFFVGTADFGGGNLVSAGDYDVFVAKYDASGAHQWSQRFGGTSSDFGWAIAVDASGNVIVTGSFHGAVDFGGGNVVSAGSDDVFVAKYDASGAHQWSQRFGGTSNEHSRGVAADASGNVIVTGFFGGTADFGGGNVVSAGSDDVFVAKYDASGAHQWSQRFGGTSTDNGRGVATDASGNVIVTGFFGGTADFGGGNLVSAGDFDIFLAKFAGGTPTGVDPELVLTNYLVANYPNPFNPTTTIRYGIKERSHVTLRIYNVAGQLVRTLVDETQTAAPGYRVLWDGASNSGDLVASGVYFYKLTAKNFIKTRKMVLLK